MYASSVLTSSTVLSGKEMISNQTSCFGNALSGCSIITINVLLEVISRLSGVKIPEFHRVPEEFTPGSITEVRFDEAGATICEEVTSNLVCHTVYPLEVAQFCTPAVFDSWIHRIEECTKLKLKGHGCKIESPSDVMLCKGLKGKIMECVKETGDTPCHRMKVKIFNVGIPLVISVPQRYTPLIKGNKEHIRKAVQDCLNSLDEDEVNKCVPDLYDALVSIGMENPAYRPHSLKDQRNPSCLKPLFKDCNLLSRESLQQHVAKEFGALVNLTFGEGDVKWFSEISGGSGKVTVFGVEEPQGKKSQYPTKKPCSSEMIFKWKDRVTNCLAATVVRLGLHDTHALTLKRIIEETHKCIDKEGSLPCHLETRSDYKDLLTYLLDLLTRHTVVKRDSRSIISLWKRALGRHGEKRDEKCHESLKYENIKDCSHNMYMYLTLLDTSPSSVTAMARENEKNQECLSQSLKHCSKPIIADIMSIFMGAIGHHARKTRDVLGAEIYRPKRLISIHPMYGGVVTVCEEGTLAMIPETTPMHVHEAKSHRSTELSLLHTVSTEEEFTDTVTEPTSSLQCSEEELQAWMDMTKSCSEIRIFKLHKASAEICLEIGSSSLFGNMSLCVSEMESLTNQCGQERIYVFESILEHLQKMIQQLYAEAVQRCQNTEFCIPEKPHLVKCTGPFYDHMREMRDTGKNYESSLDLRSMKDVEQCLAAEMQKCSKKEQKTFKEIVFITYGVEIPESSKQVNGNNQYCYTYIPQETSGTKTVDFRTKEECGLDDANRWLNALRKCIDRRIAELLKKSFKLKVVSGDRAFRYMESCIHVHKVLSCKPSKMEVFEPLFTGLLLNTKQDLMRIVETVKSGTQNVRDAMECIEQLDSKKMKMCIPLLFKDMNDIYASPSAKMYGLPSQSCVANALTKCRDKSLKQIDYILKSGMGISEKSEKPEEEKNEPMNICRPIKAIDIGYRPCTTDDMHAQLQYITHCLENSFYKKTPNSMTLESGILIAGKCFEKFTTSTCYFSDEKLFSRLVRYAFQHIYDYMKSYLTEEDSQCLKLTTESHLSKCISLSFSYSNSLRNGEVVGAMSVGREILECMRQGLKGCPQVINIKLIEMLGTMSHVHLVTESSSLVTRNKYVIGDRVRRDVYNELEEYDSNIVLLNNLPEEFSETRSTLIETELDEGMDNSKVRKVREVADDPDTTLETSPDAIPTGKTTKEDQNPEEYTANQGEDATDKVTKTDLLALEGCNASSFSIWINNYRECFVSSKYKDTGRDLNNIITRILVNIEECMKHSVEKRCFPSWIQMKEFLREVVFQTKDYVEMYLSEITQGREHITDLRCVENLSLDSYINCTSNIFKYIDDYRNHRVSSDGFTEHIKNTALCSRHIYKDCSKLAITTFSEIVEVLLDLRSGTIGNQTVMIPVDGIPPERKSIGTRIVDFFKSVGNAIAKPFVWLYNKIKSFFHS